MLVLACGGGADGTSGEGPQPLPFGDDTLHDGQHTEPVEPGQSGEPAEALPGAVLFQADQVLEIRLTLDPADQAALEEQGNEEMFKPASLSIEGTGFPRVELGQVGLRHKGAWSLHHCWENALGVRDRTGACAKLSYKLKFDEFDGTSRLDGLKRLNLHASSNDATRLHELLGYELFRDFGVDAPRTAIAKVFVNGALEGLFIAVEAIDGRYTRAHFPDGGGDGNLYKEIWPSPALDPTALGESLSTNEELGDVSGFENFSAAVAGATPGSFATAMSAWVDIEHTLRYIAVDRALKNWDGIMAFYSPSRPHNFFWYHDAEGSGRFQLIPWDLDNTLWPFDPYMAPEQWVSALPVPDWNEEPSACDSRPVWEPNGAVSVTPPRCDRFLDQLAETEWSRFAGIASELLAGPFEPSRLVERARYHAALLAPIIAEDPSMDAAAWQAERANFEDHLRRAAADFQSFVAAGLIEEGAAPSGTTGIPDSGLDATLVNNFEFASAVLGSEPAGVYTYGATGSTFSGTLNQSAPIDGANDLRFSFSFTRQPGSYDEWVNLGYATSGGQSVDLTNHSRVVVSLRADRTRNVRVRLASPAYDDTFGGCWSEFGVDLEVSTTARSFELPLASFAYPGWAKQAWTVGQGWSTTDAAAFAEVRSRMSGLIFAPSASFDSNGELANSSETGYLQIDSISLR